MEKISHKNEPYHEIRPPSDEIWKMYKHYALMRMQLWTEELAWMHIRFWSEAECRWWMATIEMLWRKYDVTHKLRIFWEMRGCCMPENVCVWCVCVCVCVPLTKHHRQTDRRNKNRWKESFPAHKHKHTHTKLLCSISVARWFSSCQFRRKNRLKFRYEFIPFYCYLSEWYRARGREMGK